MLVNVGVKVTARTEFADWGNLVKKEGVPLVETRKGGSRTNMRTGGDGQGDGQEGKHWKEEVQKSLAARAREVNQVKWKGEPCRKDSGVLNG
jgi:hypothetical protein